MTNQITLFLSDHAEFAAVTAPTSRLGQELILRIDGDGGYLGIWLSAEQSRTIRATLEAGERLLVSLPPEQTPPGSEELGYVDDDTVSLGGVNAE